jgi:AcrR family transcriptional regulator
MSGTTQPTRRYESPRRREQAAETRRAILEAAERLFERDGYVGTSIARIAEEAGVAQKTVYLAFETKGRLLKALWHLRLRGDSDDVPVGRREWFKEVLDEADPERKLRLNAHNSRVVKERLAPIVEIVRAAAPADPDAEALYETMQREFHENQGEVVRSLAKRDLRPGIDPARATDILWTLNHQAPYWMLTRERGWSDDEYERWLGDITIDQLLRPPGA